MKRLVIVILLACLITFIIIASKGIIASAMAPFPPTPPPPPEEGESVAVEKAILEAVAAHQGDVLGYLVFQVRVGNIRFSGDGNWATAWIGMFDPELNDMLPTEPGLAIARREGDSWGVTLQADANWLDIINSIPVDLMAEDERDAWVATYETHLDNLPAVPLQGYLLPWPKGQSRNLSQSVGHDQYTPSGSMHYAFDFYVHDVMWNIYSSKAGTVWKYKYNVPTCNKPTCSDTQPLGNYIVLKDTTTIPTSYQLYLHLAYESIPVALRQIGAYVAQGQFIGVADNTGQSWGDHLHFQVHTYPDSYFGTAVDIVFGDVDINGGRPRVEEYDQNYCKSSDVCQNFRVSYVSGNEIAGDIVPPTGDITSPLTWETVSTPQLSIAGWASDIGLGVDTIQIMEKHAGTWYDIGPILTVSPFSFSWDWCENNIPDGALDLALRITDKEGNLTQYAGMKHFTKNYTCPTPPPSCLPDEYQVSLYADVNYQGACKKFNVGVYTNTVSLGDLYKNAASIKVGANVLVTLSKRPNLIKKPLFGETFSLDVSNLINTRVGVDTVQSLQVWLRPSTPQVPTPVWPPDYFIYTDTHYLSLDWEYPWAVTQFQARLITVPGGIITTSWQSDPYWNPGSLVPGAYIWQVRASINPGTWMTPTHLTIVTDTVTIPPTYTFPYSETMEGGLNGWSGTGLWNR